MVGTASFAAFTLLAIGCVRPSTSNQPSSADSTQVPPASASAALPSTSGDLGAAAEASDRFDGPHTAEDCNRAQPTPSKVEFGICESTAIVLTASDMPSRSLMAPWADVFNAHRIRIRINPSGLGWADWRVYRDCAEDPAPCDSFVGGGEIHAGGHATFLVRSTTSTSASGKTLTTSDPAFWPAGPLTFRLDPARDLLYLEKNGDWPICGSSGPPPDPGEAFPCS